MGFLKNTTQIDLKAKLTPQGRVKLISNDNTLITSFRLGDSDSLYTSFSGLTGGEVPQISGDYNGEDINNGGVNYLIKSFLNYKTNVPNKPVEVQSISVNNTFEELGYKSIEFSGGSITQNLVSLSDLNMDTLVNLYYSFGLPISSADFNTYTGQTSQTGGLSDTTLSGLASTKILVIGIDGDEYSELIDGKSIKLSITTTAQTYNMYSTYQNTSLNVVNEDSKIIETSQSVNNLGPNVSLIFSDEIKRPNNDNTKSWSTGYSQNKPFSVGGKERFNMLSNPSLSIFADEAIGVAYLDKGFIVITNPDIVNDFDINDNTSELTNITFNTIRNKVTQSITCIANRGEFSISNNPTWVSNDIPRITEVGLYDNTNTLIAIGKLNKTYEKSKDDFVAFNITIDY